MDSPDTSEDVDAAVEAVATALVDADVAAAFTGAGVSAASGVPTFRGEDGVWTTEFDPADFHRSRFDRDPGGFWTDRVTLHDRLFGADPAPNAAHEALADLEHAGLLEATVTQNTDGLHARAGSTTLELHGNAARAACEQCGETVSMASAVEAVEAGETPPRCDCGGVLKPDVVLFGEGLPDAAFERARSLAARSDVFLAAGSSLTVEPAASLPRLAARDGALVVLNLEATPIDGRAAHVVREDVTATLPAIRDAALADFSDTASSNGEVASETDGPTD